MKREGDRVVRYITAGPGRLVTVSQQSSTLSSAACAALCELRNQRSCEDGANTSLETDPITTGMSEEDDDDRWSEGTLPSPHEEMPAIDPRLSELSHSDETRRSGWLCIRATGSTLSSKSMAAVRRSVYRRHGCRRLLFGRTNTSLPVEKSSSGRRSTVCYTTVTHHPSLAHSLYRDEVSIRTMSALAQPTGGIPASKRTVTGKRRPEWMGFSIRGNLTGTGSTNAGEKSVRTSARCSPDSRNSPDRAHGRRRTTS